MSKDELKKGLTDLTSLPPDLEVALSKAKGRREKKIADSAFGLLIALFGLGVYVLAGFLALRPAPSLILLGGLACVGTGLLVFGALVADRETVWPVLRGMMALAFSIKRVRSTGTGRE